MSVYNSTIHLIYAKAGKIKQKNEMIKMQLEPLTHRRPPKLHPNKPIHFISAWQNNLIISLANTNDSIFRKNNS